MKHHGAVAPRTGPAAGRKDQHCKEVESKRSTARTPRGGGNHMRMRQTHRRVHPRRTQGRDREIGYTGCGVRACLPKKSDRYEAASCAGVRWWRAPERGCRLRRWRITATGGGGGERAFRAKQQDGVGASSMWVRPHE
jgi:hypothetical protein